MRETGRPGHGERARIAARVRALLGEPESAQPPRPAGPAADHAWLPGDWLDVAGPPFASGLPPAAPGLPAASGLPSPQVAPRLGLRWQPDRRAVTAVALAVVVAGLVTAWWVLSARPRHLAVRSSPAGAPAVSSGPTSSSSSGEPSTPVNPSATASTGAARLVVDVAGKVRHPGVYRLAPGSRVVDAVRAAGGARHGVSTNSLNLAAQLQDGQQVLVGAPAQSGTGQPGAADAAAATGFGAGVGAQVDLNTATLEQLEALPGVGPVLGQRILDWRTQHGSFTSVEQLDEVSGIGPAKFAQLRDAVTL